MEERTLTEELIGYDTSTPEGIRLCAGFVKGWLEARDIEARQIGVRDLPVTIAEVGPAGRAADACCSTAISTSSPGARSSSSPGSTATACYGRGAYDMKGALACLLLALADLREQDQVRVRLGIVPDEESEEEDDRGGRPARRGGLPRRLRDHRRADRHARRGRRQGRARDADPGLRARRPRGDAVAGRERDPARVRGVPRDRVATVCEPSSELFDRPSINLGRILGGDALNKVPDTCFIDVDVRYLPEQDPTAILAEVRELSGARVISTFSRPPVVVDPDSAVRAGPLRRGGSAHRRPGEGRRGRDGASDAVSFLRAGVPAVEFGPLGGGHHGPDEWVSVPSLASYRQAIVDFVRGLPGVLGAAAGDELEEAGG